MPKTKTVTKVAKPADTRLKRKAAASAPKRPTTSKRVAPAKDHNKPKRPPTAFFEFMSDFREQFKKEYPNNKSVAVVAKAGGSKWRLMSVADKAPYVEKAVKNKKEYENKMRAYINGLGDSKNPSDGESDKSKSEVNDEEEEEE